MARRILFALAMPTGILLEPSITRGYGQVLKPLVPALHPAPAARNPTVPEPCATTSLRTFSAPYSRAKAP